MVWHSRALTESCMYYLPQVSVGTVYSRQLSLAAHLHRRRGGPVQPALYACDVKRQACRQGPREATDCRSKHARQTGRKHPGLQLTVNKEWVARLVDCFQPRMTPSPRGPPPPSSNQPRAHSQYMASLWSPRCPGLAMASHRPCTVGTSKHAGILVARLATHGTCPACCSSMSSCNNYGRHVR